MTWNIQEAFESALRWKVSGDIRYADQAVRFLNAWSSTMTTLTGDADRFLASGLYGFTWAATAEIMRTYSGWAAADVAAFQNYLLSIYYPMEHDFITNHNGAYVTNYWANWDLANLEGMMGVGIFCDRHDVYQEAMNYLYNGGGNGALDKIVYYLFPGNLAQWEESGRDQGHTVLGMELFGDIAQMAWNQGDDLFSYRNNQFLAAAEYVAKYNLGYDVPFEWQVWQYGAPGVWGGWQTMTTVSSASRPNNAPAFELIYSHYASLEGFAAPYSWQRVKALRPEGSQSNGDSLGFGTLMYALPPLTGGQAPKGLTASERGSQGSGPGNIELDWFGGANDTSYNVYRSTSQFGAYSLIASNITDLLTYTDRNLPAGTYYYKVTGVSSSVETAPSNVVYATSSTLIQTQLLFNESAGTTAADATGNGSNGTLTGGASFVPGKSGNAVSLDGTSGYVSLPANIVQTVSDFTISAWVYLNSASTWARVFDFGDNRGRWMYLTVKNGSGVPEFATSTDYYGNNKQWVTGNAALPLNQWVHLAVTLSGRLGTLYVNGIAVGSNANMDFSPAEIGQTPNNWLGRSQFSNDPYLNGKIDDFRIYRGAMKTGDVYALATDLTAPSPPAAPASFSAAAVPGNQINLSWSTVSGATSYLVWRSTTSGGPYAALATLRSGTSYSDTGLTAGTTYYYVVTAANLGGDGANSAQASAVALPPMPGTPTGLVAGSVSSTSIGLTWSASSDAATYTIKRSLTSGGPYTSVATGITATTYFDAGLTSGVTYYYVVTAVNAAGESSNSNESFAATSDLFQRLQFDEMVGTTAGDSSGNNRGGTLVNGPAWTTGKINGAINLNGSSQYVSLPTGVVSPLTSFTISTWVKITAESTWMRIFDFGTGTNDYMFLTPLGGTNVVRFAITNSGNTHEQQINGTAALPVGVWTHVAVTWTRECRHSLRQRCGSRPK